MGRHVHLMRIVKKRNDVVTYGCKRCPVRARLTATGRPVSEPPFNLG